MIPGQGRVLLLFSLTQEHLDTRQPVYLGQKHKISGHSDDEFSDEDAEPFSSTP
jgi:hypothetical protein